MSRNWFPVISLFFLFLFIFLLTAQEREIAPVTLEKISENLYQVLGGRGANGAAFIGDDAILLIEAKMDESSVEQTLTELKKISDKPVKYLVNTHSDGDHISGNRYFPETVTFVAHENCRKEFFHPGRNGTSSEWHNPELTPFVPSITFKEKMDIFLGAKKVELWYFGVGHTTGDAVVYFPEEKTAFLGDQIFVGRPQLIHSYKGGNSFQHVNTLTTMLNTLDADKFCSGHSEVIDRKVVENHIEGMKRRQEKIKDLLKNGTSLDDVKSVFTENESRLVESIYTEIKEDKY